MAGCGGPVLVMQDTVFFSYGTHVKTRGLGPIGKSNSAHDRGLIMHNALAFTSSGVPLGILSQSIWARREIPQEDYQEKIERLQVTAIEEKESSKWLVALRETVRAYALGRAGRHGGGSGIGFLRVPHASQRTAREVSDPRTHRSQAGARRQRGLRQYARGAQRRPALGSITVAVPSNGRRKARTASIEVRVAQVSIKPPERRGAHAKASGSSEPVLVTVIGATEQSAPAGSESISWVLLTNLPVKGLQSPSREGAMVRQAVGR